MEDAPGSVIPIASASAVMVEAVPMVMQNPGDRAMPLSMAVHSLVAQISGAALRPEFPEIGAAAERFPVPVAAQHGTGGKINRRQIHADRAHQQAGSGFVAASHQNRAIDGKAAERFLGIHGQQVPVEHRTGLHVGFGDGERGDFDGESSGLPDASLDGFGALAEMGVARVDFAPGVDDGDDRAAVKSSFR